MNDFKFVHLKGRDLLSRLQEVGNLRVKVFREFPYLYEGSQEYEKEYLSRYANSKRSLTVLVLHKDKPIAASTCLPLQDESSEFRDAFQNSSLDLNKIFYFGESIVLSEYRGKGLGKEFFKLRELHACETMPNLTHTTFCAVNRPSDHHLRPPAYRSLDEFWIKQGYTKQIDVVAKYDWKDFDKTDEDTKSLTFWTKSWN